MTFFLGCALGILIAVCESIDNREPDPRTPAQRRAMREDCRRKGL